MERKRELREEYLRSKPWIDGIYARIYAENFQAEAAAESANAGCCYFEAGWFELWYTRKGSVFCSHRPKQVDTI